MASKRRNILIIGVRADEFEHVAPFLDRHTFEVDRFPSARGSLELLSSITFELLIVRFPLFDMVLEEFLSAVRSDQSTCLKSPILLLATDGRQAEAETLIGRGANRVVSLEESATLVQGLVSELLAVAPRKSARFMARLEIRLGGAKDMILCETENLSASGMLIKTDRQYDKGTQLEFEFTLPEEHRPIAGVAEIVRVAGTLVREAKGIGVRFLSFAGDSQRRFETYLSHI